MACVLVSEEAAAAIGVTGRGAAGGHGAGAMTPLGQNARSTVPATHAALLMFHRAACIQHVVDEATNGQMFLNPWGR